MKLPKKLQVLMKLKGKKFGGKFHDWSVVKDMGRDVIQGSKEPPEGYESEYDDEDYDSWRYRCTISSKIVDFHGKNVVETNNSFYLLGRRIDLVVSSNPNKPDKVATEKPTMKTIAAALKELVSKTDGTWPTNGDEALKKGHILDMLDRLESGEVSGEKAHRWLGWAQAAIVGAGVGDLELMKKINNGI